jgi:hypothetical protein
MFHVAKVLRTPAFAKRRASSRTVRRYASTRHIRKVVLDPCLYPDAETHAQAPLFFDEAIFSLHQQGKIVLLAHPDDEDEFIVKYRKH